jgi:uncharacterized membrane protein
MLRDTNPKHWKLGVFYFNPDQRHLFVAKRFGGLFTLNLANPVAWIVVGILPAVAGLLAN